MAGLLQRPLLITRRLPLYQDPFSVVTSFSREIQDDLETGELLYDTSPQYYGVLSPSPNYLTPLARLNPPVQRLLVSNLPGMPHGNWQI